MKVLNFGSLNVDYVYSVDHMIIGGETQLAEKMEAFCGEGPESVCSKSWDYSISCRIRNDGDRNKEKMLSGSM